ncbi:unnamed protein product [Heligmosomoides polygyrus]|uniref:Uncharacterized protein n=1 Tax=Heligmosomoides polygyrus TaxID=6339 RepID=A0A183FND9_HELPZ|nr:unnamed protein product [Heligmosomoides polygyrus]
MYSLDKDAEFVVEQHLNFPGMRGLFEVMQTEVMASSTFVTMLNGTWRGLLGSGSSLATASQLFLSCFCVP